LLEASGQCTAGEYIKEEKAVQPLLELFTVLLMCEFPFGLFQFAWLVSLDFPSPCRWSAIFPVHPLSYRLPLETWPNIN